MSKLKSILMELEICKRTDALKKLQKNSINKNKIEARTKGGN